MKLNCRTIVALWLLACTAANAQVDVQPNGDFNYAEVLYNGWPARKLDIVFIGDGYTAAEQGVFNTHVEDALQAMQTTPPYANLMCAFNVWRVNVVSLDSGIDRPSLSLFYNTELDVRFGDPAAGETERCIRSDSPQKIDEAASHAPAANLIVVLANTSFHGGCAPGIVYSGTGPGWWGTFIHELSHRIGGLADEYHTDNRDYTFSEPPYPNVTRFSDFASIKWNDLIDLATPLPTIDDIPQGVVGAFEGGWGVFATGIFRPQFTCMMKSLGSSFCAVCDRTIRQNLAFNCDSCDPFAGVGVCR
ncbi:MAG: M64 family metallopeptidase, partial [Phycisphaerae bacterium]